jgi:DNA gyrase/topoisomerase IV subunit A
MTDDGANNVHLLRGFSAAGTGITDAELSAVEQTHQTLAKLIAHWDRWLQADRELDQITGKMFEQIHAELADLRESILALSNRQSSTDRVLRSLSDIHP